MEIQDLPSFRWATVTDTEPIEVKVDGDTAPLALIPDSLVDPLTLSVGDRVRVELSLRKCVIHGKSNGIISTQDTGWVTSGMSFSLLSGWQLDTYSLRRFGNRVSGNIVLEYTGATLTAGADANLSDQNGVLLMPEGWRTGSPTPQVCIVWRNGYSHWVGRIQQASSPTHGEVDLVAASFPGQVLSSGFLLTFWLDYFID